MCIFAEGALDPDACVIAEGDKQHWSQYRPREGDVHLDIELLTSVLRMWLSNKFLIHQTVTHQIHLFSLGRRMLKGSVSNSLQKSR